MTVKCSTKTQVIVIGAGPVGIKFTHELLATDADLSIKLFGDETWSPYNRVGLSNLLAGQIGFEDVWLKAPENAPGNLFQFLNCRITSINPAAKLVTDVTGIQHHYDKLVLATGSRPFIPDIPGNDLVGVYTFRHLGDVESLMARRMRTRHCVVVGGGLLGLEAAKSLARAATKVTVIQQANRLMNRQLDDFAATILADKMRDMGIEILLGQSVRKILGRREVDGVFCRNGDVIWCDTVVFCAGIKPNIELARTAWINVDKGIIVDDTMRTSKKDVYAVGECIEHKGKTYGVVQPGFDQAAVAAHAIAGDKQVVYAGSLSAAELKVVGEKVLSVGDVKLNRTEIKSYALTYKNEANNVYRKLVFKKGYLVGAMSVGEWKESLRVSEMIMRRKTPTLIQRFRFWLSGNLFMFKKGDDVFYWHNDAVICSCKGVTLGEIKAAAGTRLAMRDIQNDTGAMTVCGSCKPLVAKILTERKDESFRIGKFVFVLAAVCLLCWGGVNLSAL